jgi:hypothetical protein
MYSLYCTYLKCRIFWNNTCCRIRIRYSDRWKKNLSSIPLCFTQLETYVREKGNRKLSVEFVVRDNRKEEGGSPLHPRDFTHCLFPMPTWYYHHLHPFLPSKSFLTDPLCVCVCVCLSLSLLQFSKSYADNIILHNSLLQFPSRHFLFT